MEDRDLLIWIKGYLEGKSPIITDNDIKLIIGKIANQLSKIPSPPTDFKYFPSLHSPNQYPNWILPKPEHRHIIEYTIRDGEIVKPPIELNPDPSTK